MRMRTAILVGLMLTTCSAAFATGQYGTITMTYVNDNYPDAGAGSQSPPSAVLHIAGSVANNQRVLVGGSNFVIGTHSGDITNGADSNPFDGWYGETLRAYCVDVYAWISYGTKKTWDVNPLASAPQGGNASAMGEPKAKMLAELADLYLDDTHINSALTAAAFQASVWEIVNEDIPADPATGYSLGGGDFRMTGWKRSNGTNLAYADVAGIAEGWLHSLILPGNDPAGDFSFVNVGKDRCDTAGAQDFGYLVQHPKHPPIPEPVTMFSVFMAVSGLGAYVRRRTKATVAA